METIGTQQLFSWLSGSERAERVSNDKVRKDPGHNVGSYLELAKKIAELQYRNSDFVLFFRGQNKDYKNKQGASSLRPSILREIDKRLTGASVTKTRFERLLRAEELLVQSYDLTGRDRIRKHQVLRWAILQHYEVCDTPLLDVTQSARIAASFASHNASDAAFVYVLGVPNVSGAVTASAEAGLEILRLSSVCPPEAVRPHIQEGFLLSEFPELSSFRQKQFYENYQTDFGLRLVCKFRFEPNSFWLTGQDFPIVPPGALYPRSADDPLIQVTDAIRSTLPM